MERKAERRQRSQAEAEPVATTTGRVQGTTEPPGPRVLDSLTLATSEVITGLPNACKL